MFLDSSIPINGNRRSIPGYSMVRADHPINTKRSGISGIEITGYQMPDKTSNTIKYLLDILKIHRTSKVNKSIIKVNKSIGNTHYEKAFIYNCFQLSIIYQALK